MNALLRIADRLLGRPLLITPHKAEIIYSLLEGRLNLDERPAAYREPAPSSRRSNSGVFVVPVTEGVAHITVDGSLVNRGAYVGASSGLVSYEGIHAQIAAAHADKQVKGILLDLNTPGGEVGGLFALCQRIRAARAAKPVIAFINDMAASAGYAIAAQASQVIVSPSSVVGSIGVVLLHLDRSAQMAAQGVRPTLIHAGAHKVDGNPFEPLPDDARHRLQAEVNQLYDLLLESVATGRGARLTAAAARATEAETYIGKDGVARGLADAIAPFHAVMRALSAGRTIEAAAPARMAVPGDPSAAAEKARLRSILGGNEAEGREQLAQHLAFETDVSADAAHAILAQAPRVAVPDTSPASHVAFPASVLPLAAIEPPCADRRKRGWAEAIESANRTFRKNDPS